MPSGKTHDAITFLLAVPTFSAAYLFTRDAAAASTAAAAFTFGGLMFGPDLDTVSTQYSRWWIFKPLWFPYRVVFRHRSRWSHGLIFGTLFRVIYFMGILTIGAAATAIAAAAYNGGHLPNAVEFPAAWRELGELAKRYLGENSLIFIFTGLWLGAASHTVADVAGSFIKTGRVTEFM